MLHVCLGGRQVRAELEGIGEAGTIGAAPTVINAIVDAIHPHTGLKHIDMPVTPSRVWTAMNA